MGKPTGYNILNNYLFTIQHVSAYWPSSSIKEMLQGRYKLKYEKVKVKVKVMHSHYRPGQALRVPGG